MHIPIINLDHPARYFSVGPFSVSIGNAAVIVLMIVIFTVALFLPFPHGKGDKK